MKIKWLAHASFLITSQDGKKLITDPYNVGNGLNYAPIVESADVVTRSHAHGDHNNTGAIKGNPVVLTEAGAQTIKGIPFKTIEAFHDEAGGSKRGKDLIFCFRVDGLDLCHLGDLGHRLDPQQLAAIGPVDLLFIPVGGFYTIDAVEAVVIACSLKPKIIFPMHYKTAKSDYPIAGVEAFLKGQKNVRRLDASEIELDRATLPAETEIVILKSAN
jgi:L-ascorbate metabolism protein UlaG (beta-lactamase superfamily)